MNILNSYAKINLGLEVLGKRSDGFHEISSILCKIDLFDQISFFNSDENQVSQIGINQNENIVTLSRPSEQKKHKAAHGLYRTLINNMVEGVSNGYSIKLELVKLNKIF